MSVLDEPLHFGAAPVASARPGAPGRVTLVGAGPGDPGLLTLKAARALERASLVLVDHLVGPGVLALLPRHAERIDVGKESARHTLSQAALIALMLRLARSGRDLVRLKGGDGYIFGRGGEEAQALAAAGIPFEVIPGITAAQGAAASVGIPLTHRDHAGTLIYTTGHLRSDHGDAGSAGEPALDLDWATLARPRQTVVIYMGVGTLPLISAGLMAHGLPGDTPAALIERATRVDERCLVGTLATLPALARLHGVRAPALIVIGTVVGLRQVLGAVDGGVEPAVLAPVTPHA